MHEMSLETCASNLKSVANTILELLAFNAQTVLLTGSLRAHKLTHNPVKTLPPPFTSFTWRR